jgi:hypothetical protein
MAREHNGLLSVPVGVGRRTIISSRAAVWLSRCLLALSTAFIVFALVLLLHAGGALEGDPLFVAFRFLVAFSFSFMGTLVSSRHPANAIGWIFSFMGINLSLSGAATAYAESVLGQAGQFPWGTLGAWYSSWVWFFFVVPALVLLPVLYPTGRPLSARWAVVLWIATAATLVGIVSRAIEAGPLNVLGYDDNPFAASFQAPVELLFGVGMSTILLCMVGASVSLVVRFRRSRGIERQQLLSFFCVAALLPLPIGPALVGFVPAQTVFVLLIAALPFATGFAILRRGLFDINVIVRRTLVYGATTAAIAVAFFTGIVVLQAALGPLTGRSDFAVAASTLFSVALFQPIRRWAQSTVDRRFYRARYDAARTLDEFSVRLRDEVDLDAVRAELVDAAQRTVQPTHASVWLRRSTR